MIAMHPQGILERIEELLGLRGWQAMTSQPLNQCQLKPDVPLPLVDMSVRHL